MRKICRKLHLWLGLASGVIVFIVCITGCMYVFKDEIRQISEPYKQVQAQERAFIKPSQAINMANRAAKNSSPAAITYGEKTDAVVVDYGSFMAPEKTEVCLNPYTGKVLHVKTTQAAHFDFFAFVLRGHRSLWLPQPLGGMVVSYGVLVFFITLLTGIVIWLPRRWNRRSLGRMLVVKRPLRPRRFTYDLHTVVGVYLLIPLMALCFTGLMMGLDWFAGGMYRLVSGGKEMQAYVLPESDTLHVNPRQQTRLDALHATLTTEEPAAVQFYYALPDAKAGVYRVSIVHERNSYYKTDNRFFDQYTLRELAGTGPYAGRYAEAGTADTMMRMNLSIHDGRIFGIWGKLLMCLASLIGASLPVTGAMLWWRKRQKRAD